MIKYFLIFFVLISSAQARRKPGCFYSIDSKNIKVQFTAFKTFLKLGVKGSFTDLGIRKKIWGKSIIDAASGTRFKIDTNSLITGDEGRDEKIKKFFFALMEDGPIIRGKIKSFDTDNDLLILRLEMNDEKMTIPLSYTIKDNLLKADGTIDLLDWDLKDSLKSINHVCSEQHEKKTWNDVGIHLRAKFKRVCG
jgi:polyisoprenoid-binding protein YceI